MRWGSRRTCPDCAATCRPTPGRCCSGRWPASRSSAGRAPPRCVRRCAPSAESIAHSAFPVAAISSDTVSPGGRMDTHGILLDAKLAERYTIEREIGRGGMAAVYLAADSRHHRSVAIKVLSPQLAAAVGPERFLHEIRIAAGLAHPHILPLFDSGAAEVEGRESGVELSTLDSRPSTLLYYTMPYIAGDSLRDRLRRDGALPVADAVRIAHRMAEALAYAHARDVIHRDIKPENILLGDGEPMLADFGIAQAAGFGDERLTGAGMVLGTPSYMSPEQVSGEPIDGRSDVYALGCVLYEMLLGQPPFVGGSAEVLLKRQRIEKPPAIAPLRPSVTPRLQGALDRALAKLPGDRFQSAAEFATE